MRRKPQNHSVFYYLVNSFILFLLLTSIGCSNQLNLEKHTDLVFKESYYQSWVSGVKGGGSGLIIFLTLGDSSSKNIQLEGIYFKDKYCKLTSKSDLKYQCTILKNENRETNSFIKPIENSTKEIEKIPFMIQGDEAVVEYLENKKRRYFKISLLWKKSERVPM